MFLKRLFSLLVVLTFVINLIAQENTNIQQAVSAYSKGDYSKAAELYENELKEKGESAGIYYNIGNCYYKMNKIAEAILNYERSLLLNPGDGDTRFNLEIARLKTVDKIEPVGSFFVSEWLKSLQNILDTNSWAKIGIFTFLLLIGCLVLFFFSRKIILKKSGFYMGIACLIISIAANFFSYNQKQKLSDRNTAIVFAPTVTIKSSPDNSGNDLFVLHEGTKITIKSKLSGWSEIQIADGNVGWIKDSDIEMI